MQEFTIRLSDERAEKLRNVLEEKTVDDELKKIIVKWFKGTPRSYPINFNTEETNGSNT